MTTTLIAAAPALATRAAEPNSGLLTYALRSAMAIAGFAVLVLLAG